MSNIKKPETDLSAIPDEAPMLIFFDDADRPPIVFAGYKAKECALMKFKDVSVSWNAHLFARVMTNSSDDRFPSVDIEAYAAERVREALEQAAKTPREYALQLDKNGWGNRFPDELTAIFNAADNMADRIRALITKQ